MIRNLLKPKQAQGSLELDSAEVAISFIGLEFGALPRLMLHVKNVNAAVIPDLDAVRRCCLF